MLPPNQTDPANPAIASRFHVGHHCRGITDPGRSATLRFMKILTHIGLALFAIFSLGTVTASAEDVPSGLSAYITAVTNRVSTLSGLEFSVVVTNSATTNIIIHPWILKNGLGTVVIFNARGLKMAYHPKPPIMAL